MDQLKIYVHRLRHGETEEISTSILPDRLGLEPEKDILFPHPIQVALEAYIADQHLIVRLQIKTQVQLPCSICNESFTLQLNIPPLCESCALDEIPEAIFDCGPQIREAILLQLPPFFECHGGCCPEREQVKKYLKPPSASCADETHFPFAHL